jgi:hypothetical protein
MEPAPALQEVHGKEKPEIVDSNVLAQGMLLGLIWRQRGTFCAELEGLARARLQRDGRGNPQLQRPLLVGIGGEYFQVTQDVELGSFRTEKGDQMAAPFRVQAADLDLGSLGECQGCELDLSILEARFEIKV